MYTCSTVIRPVLGMWQGKKTFIRPVEVSDAPLILEWENNPEFWPMTAFPGPFILEDILQFIQSSQGLHKTGQVRWMVCECKSDRTVGAIDLFANEKQPRLAGIGVLIGALSDRNRGFAFDALNRIIQVAREELDLSELECLIYPDNHPSLRLFEKLGFVITATEWFKNRNAFRLRLKLE
jgi:diamine N-acetyltransferase